MRSRFAPIAALLALATPGVSHAYVVAGWDFSQYLGDALLTLDGTNGATTLSANYSNLDPTFNAGAESAAFGTMYIDGSFGSTAIDPFDPAPAIVPTAAFEGSLESNLYAPAPGPGTNPFDSHTILALEGQTFTNFLSMRASEASSMVFRADLSSVPETGSNWVLSFGGRTFTGTSQVSVDFSSNGGAFSPAQSVTLTETDTPFEVDLGPAPVDVVFVRLNFQPEGLDWPIIDNVAISVPEPGAGAGAFAAALGVALCRCAAPDRVHAIRRSRVSARARAHDRRAAVRSGRGVAGHGDAPSTRRRMPRRPR